jgi:hypothetical protein
MGAVGNVINCNSGSEPFPVGVPRLSVWRHVPPPPPNGDFSLIVYFQNDKVHFKQTLFSSWKAPFIAQEWMRGSCYFFPQHVTNIILEVNLLYIIAVYFISVNIANNIFSLLASILALYEMYLTRTVMWLHVSRGGPWTPGSERLSYRLGDRFSISGKVKMFSYPARSDRLLGPLSYMCSGYQGSFRVDKAAGAWTWPLASSVDFVWNVTSAPVYAIIWYLGMGTTVPKCRCWKLNALKPCVLFCSSWSGNLSINW